MSQGSGNLKCFHVTKYYKVTDIVLGRGSFSTVYLAYHLTFGSKVALKVINRNHIKEEYVLKNLHREAKILMKLNHPNIVKFYEELSQEELYCISMEYISGVNLSQYLWKQDLHRVTEKIAQTLFYQMVSAVHHMHQNNILHRDLKQENILLEHGRIIKIVDFGLSNTYYPNIVLRTHCGSMIYAAPELFQSRSVYGSAVDLWSLGVILYTMLVGRIPFEMPASASSSSTSYQRKDLFLKRILQGLTQENWEHMKMLSKDCCNLLKNLLQPDQFKRMHINGTMYHPWFMKDKDLRKRLPQHRADLREKFHPEIIDFMTDKLCVSKERVQNHIKKYKFDRISAIFYILQDTLMKDVLYPPRCLESSFLFKFEKWRTAFTMEKEASKNSKSVATTKVLQLSEEKALDSIKNNFTTHEEDTKSARFKNKEITTKSGKQKSDFKQIETGSIKPQNERSNPRTILKRETKLKDSDNTSILSKTDTEGTSNDVSRPFKSYKNSRPSKLISKLQSEVGEVRVNKDIDRKHCNTIGEGDGSTFSNKSVLLNKNISNKSGIKNHLDGKIEPEIINSEENRSKSKGTISSFVINKNTKRFYTTNCNISKRANTKTSISNESQKNRYISVKPRQSQIYMQRNIIINRADRGCGGSLLNSTLTMRNTRNTSSKNDQESRFQDSMTNK